MGEPAIAQPLVAPSPSRANSNPRKRATHADLAALPEHVVGEIIDGELFVHPRPAFLHAGAASMLGTSLVNPFWHGRGGPGGWVILFEPEIHCAGDVFVPDLAGWRRERMQELPDTAFTELVPDWVCEVLSPGNSWVQRARKMNLFAREAIPHVWLVDPREQLLEVFELRDALYARLLAAHGDEKVRAAPFDAIELNLADLWAR